MALNIQKKVVGLLNQSHRILRYDYEYVQESVQKR